MKRNLGVQIVAWIAIGGILLSALSVGVLAIFDRGQQSQNVEQVELTPEQIQALFEEIEQENEENLGESEEVSENEESVEEEGESDLEKQ